MLFGVKPPPKSFMRMRFGKEGADAVWKEKPRQEGERGCFGGKPGKEEVTRMAQGHKFAKTYMAHWAVWLRWDRLFGEQHVGEWHCKTISHQPNSHVCTSYVIHWNSLWCEFRIWFK